jgi:hypothetical protein
MGTHPIGILRLAGQIATCALVWHIQPARGSSRTWIAPVAANPEEPGLDSTIGQRPQGGYGADIIYAVTPADFRDDATTKQARDLLKAWHYQFGHEGYLDCMDKNDAACKAALSRTRWAFFHADNLAFQVWARMRSHHGVGSSCSEVSIAFRGTEFTSVSDWASNLHQVLGLVTDDEYDQLGRNINAIIRKITRLGCYLRAGGAQLVSVGHSLGGGLAQFSALANSPTGPRIRKVFAFDPSPVTAYTRINANTRQANSKGLAVDRIHQRGEILSTYLGWDQQYPSSASPCNPLVRTVEYDAFAPGPSKRPQLYQAIQLHRMAPLAAKLVEWSYDSNGHPVRLTVPEGNGCPTDYIEPGPKVRIGVPVAGLSAAVPESYASAGSYRGTITSPQYHAAYQFPAPGRRLAARFVELKHHKMATRPVRHAGNKIHAVPLLTTISSQGAHQRRSVGPRQMS